MNKNRLFKIGLMILTFTICAVLVTAIGTVTVYNPYTTKLDFISNGNFSELSVNVDTLTVDKNITMAGNITLVECIHFVSGGKVCTG